MPHADTMVDNVYDAMMKSMSQMHAQDASTHGESVARQKIEAKAKDDVMALVRSEYNWQGMQAEMIDAYQKTFTEEEVTAMINFYATPAGQATITKMPQLMQAMMASTQAHMQSLMPRIRAISDKANADAQRPTRRTEQTPNAPSRICGHRACDVDVDADTNDFRWRTRRRPGREDC